MEKWQQVHQAVLTYGKKRKEKAPGLNRWRVEEVEVEVEVGVGVAAVFGWGTWCFVPMKNTILYSDKASAISGKEQLQWTVFTARYLLGQVKASSV